MSHDTSIKKLTTETGDKVFSFNVNDTDDSNNDNVEYIFRSTLKQITFSHLGHQDSDHENANRGRVFFTGSDISGSALNKTINMSLQDFTEIMVFFYGEQFASDYVPGTTSETPDMTEEDETPKTLIEDPVIYERPETGISQYNIPFFKFHNPNGKSAITISMTDVDYTKFDSLNDDTHQYIVVTKGQSKIRCVCTVAEQLGLEWRFRGTTHVISAAESNTTRLIQESLDNPE